MDINIKLKASKVFDFRLDLGKNVFTHVRTQLLIRIPIMPIELHVVSVALNNQSHDTISFIELTSVH